MANLPRLANSIVPILLELATLTRRAVVPTIMHNTNNINTILTYLLCKCNNRCLLHLNAAADTNLLLQLLEDHQPPSHIYLLLPTTSVIIPPSTVYK
jgi:hypothetical protein